MGLNQDYDYLFKVLITGNSCVGKSNILLRFSENIFHESFLPTIGVDFKIKNVMVNDKQVKLHIWDTAGQERFKTITATYYKGAHAVMLVYDITDRQTFQDIDTWLNEALHNGGKDITRILVGNKCDMENKRQVSYNEGKAYAESQGMKFLETSALNKINIEESFKTLSQELLKKNPGIQNPNNQGHTFTRDRQKEKKESKSCC